MKSIRIAIAKFVYKIIRPYLKVDKWKDPMTLHLCFTLNIFGEKVSEIEYSQYELVERRIL